MWSALRHGAIGLLLLSLMLPLSAEVIDKELPSGLRVVVVESIASPTVSVNVFISAGSLDETPEQAGLAHFYEHMFFRGTPSLSGLDFKKAIESMGGMTNATTAKDMTHYFIGLPAEHAERGLELLADALQRAELETEGIDVEREVVLEEYRLSENNPGRIAGEKLYRMAYGDHPYGRSTIGTKDTIKSFQRPDFVKWRNEQYGPERCTVVVVGDVSANRIFAKAKTLFSGYKSTASAPRKLIAPPAVPDQPVSDEGPGPVGSPVLFRGYPAPSAHDQPDVYAVDVLSFLLGQGKQSMLHRALVDENDLANSVDVSFLTPRQRGLIIISTSIVDKKQAEVQAEIDKTIKAVIAGEFNDKDLERAKAHLLGAYALQNESNSGVADTIGFYAALGVPGFHTTYATQIARVTRADVVGAAQKYMGGGYWSYLLKPGRGGRR